MPKTILLADDSVTIQKVVGISFANEDVVLLTVDNGDDAVLQARESRPDIVLADIVMPGKSGYEVCEALRSDPELRDIPVLLLSGTFETFDEERAQEVGAHGHITKPFEAQSLVDRVNELLEAGDAANAPTTSGGADLTMGTSFSDPAASLSGSQAYDFFDEDIPAIPGESPPLAETKLIGADPSNDSMSGQVFDLEPMEERSVATAEPALETAVAEGAASSAPASPPSEEALAEIDDGFGSSFAPEEPVASSSAFSFQENPDLAEAVEAFAHPDTADSPLSTDLDPMTSPVAEPALGAASAGTKAPEADVVSDDVPARGVSQTFDATEVHEPDPIAGDDLYEDFGEPVENELFAESAEPAAPFAEPAVRADPAPEPFESPAASDLESPRTNRLDEDPESLSQSALEPLPEAEEADGAFSEAPIEGVAEDPFADARAAPTSIRVEAPIVAGSITESPAPAAGVSKIPAELQERMHASLERIAWEAMGDLSERVIKETLSRIESIAWEVIPQMAETMIREELDRISGRDDEPE